MTRPKAAVRAVGQVALGAALAGAGTGHLTAQREEFRAQVPPWFPADPDAVVVVSGIVEIGLGAALLAAWRQPSRGVVGILTAAFFVAVLPGNVAQLTEHRDAFGLDTDAKRAVRLLFQPLLVLWALAATGGWGLLGGWWRGRSADDQPVTRRGAHGQPVREARSRADEAT